MYSGNRCFQGIRLTDQKQENLSETMFQRVLLDFVLKTFGLGAENETRTRDPNLGKVVLYQLSYFRILYSANCRTFEPLQPIVPDCKCKYRAKKITVQENLKKN